MFPAAYDASASSNCGGRGMLPIGSVGITSRCYIVPGFRVVSLPSALVAVLVIGFLNMTLGLILKIVTFPFAILAFIVRVLLFHSVYLPADSYDIIS